MKPILLAKKFVAGTGLNEVLDVSEELISKGLKVTLDHLGEDVANKYKALQAKDLYLNLIRECAKRKGEFNISVKLSQIGLAIDKKFALENALEIAVKAKELGIGMEVDMESYNYLEDTLGIYFQLLKRNKSAVQAIQAYLFRSERDVRDIISKGGNIRLVKGAYKEKKRFAYNDKKKVNDNYRKIMKLALTEGNFIAIGTHDEEIINEAIDFIESHNIPDKNFEFEMLYGIKHHLQEDLAKEFPVRIYVPYGEDWAPYFYRRLRERKENFFFALKNLFG